MHVGYFPVKQRPARRARVVCSGVPAQRTRPRHPAVARAHALLKAARGQAIDGTALCAAASELSAALLEATAAERSREERRRSALLARLMEDPDGQVFSTLLTDRVYRSSDPGRVVDQARHLLRSLGTPKYLPALARAQLRLLLHTGPFVPKLAARGVLAELRRSTREVVRSSEPASLSQHLELRRSQGVRVNLNQLGEAVLGEHEAELRLREYLALLARPDVEAISVKLSSIASRIDLLAYADTLAELRPRLREIYRAALAHTYTRTDGTRHAKLVSLDMEAHRDLGLTLELFTSVLDEPELRPLHACIVLQAYLPETIARQRELTAWAITRVDGGGAPVRLRIVKGANLAGERAESSLRGWPVPSYEDKVQVDASYKRMLLYGTLPAHARAVSLGIASHNLFDVAYGLLLRASRGVEAHVGFELLEGMAEPLRRVLCELTGDLLAYCPVVADASMQTAIAYLLRRLDENTAHDNFLRSSFAMQSGDAGFGRERKRFEAACALAASVDERPRRTQDRRMPAVAPTAGRFENEPDTEFARPENREWIGDVLRELRARPRFEVPFRIGGERTFERSFADGFDPSRPDFVPYRFALATPAQIERSLATAARAAQRCRTTSIETRVAWLRAIAQGLRTRRGELIAAMVLDAGKRVDQADTEVSEAVDFAEYYAQAFTELATRPELSLAPKGVVLVTPPWNFPLAIPAGGVFAALVTGNAVLLKPATETVFVAERFAELCWDAGVPVDALQLVFCEDEVGSLLVRDRRVDTVVLTGATATARLFQRLHPGLDLLAETGGKNAIVVTALADRDQAIKDALSSAFGHAGQKCSAASLLLCEAEVYDDPAFVRTLEDAVASLPVGSAWDLRSVVTPLIRPPSGALLRGLTVLDAGERWLVPPCAQKENPCLWSPGVKVGVVAGSITHQTELFGPVLGVMRTNDLDHAIELMNGTPYGLTAGLASLDEREQRRWAERVHAGNLYINRGITGAVVRRQPFGGCKASSFGPGAKAGGPNYLLGLARVADGALSESLDPPNLQAAALLARIKRNLDAGDHRQLATAACRYQHAMRREFAVNRDPSRVIGELNAFRYLPASTVLVRVSADGVLGEALLACLAGLTAGATLALSVEPTVMAGAPWLPRLPHVAVFADSRAACAERLAAGITRVRAIGTVEPEVLRAAEAAQVHVAASPVLLAGRIELLHYLREQTLSVAYHRSGYCEGVRLLPWAAEP